MARPENPINPADGPAAMFASELRKLRRAVGSPTYREMAGRAHCSPPSLSTAANGRQVPSWEMTQAFLRGCNVTSLVELDQWRQRWGTARTGTTGDEQPMPPPAILELNHGLPQSDWRLPAVPTAPWPHLDVEGFATWDAFVDGLNQIRAVLGLSYRDITHRSSIANLPKIGEHQSTSLAISTISDVLKKKRRVSLGFIYAYLDACGATPAEILRWANTWREIGIEERRLRRAMDAMRKPDEEGSTTAQHRNMVQELQKALTGNHANNAQPDRAAPAPPVPAIAARRAAVTGATCARSEPARRRRPRPPAHRDPGDTIKIQTKMITIEIPADRTLLVFGAITAVFALLVAVQAAL